MSQTQTEQSGGFATDAVVDAADELAQAENELTTRAAEIDLPVQGEGVRVRRAFMMKNFLPDPSTGGVKQWIMQNVVSHGPGTHVSVGRIYGMVYESEPRETKQTANGVEKSIKSVALSGDLEAVSMAGEVSRFDMLFLPMAFAAQIHRALQSGANHVELDVDIGIAASGGNIPYEWTVTSYLSGKAERALGRMRAARQIGQPAKAVMASTPAPAAITHAVDHNPDIQQRVNAKSRR